MYRSLEIETRLWYRLIGALRRSERSFIWPTLIPLSTHPAARFHALVKSARRAIKGKKGSLWLLARKANTLDTWWQISYNAACAYATRAEIGHYPAPGRGFRKPGDGCDDTPAKKRCADADEALRFLEQTLVRPGVEQLSADWAVRDPDLVALATFPRFQRFLDQLRPCT